MSPPGSASERFTQLLFALAAAGLGIAAMIGSARLGQSLGLGLRGQLAAGSLALAAPSLALLAARGTRRAVVGAGRLAPRTLVLSALVGACFWLFSLGVLELQSLVRPPTPQELEFFRWLHASLAATGPFDFLGSLLVIALLPALCEELVMRGVLLTSLAPLAGALPAVLLTAVAFALIHDPLRMPFVFVLGMGLGLLRVRMESLWPPVVAHASLNSLTFALAPLVDDPTQPYTPSPALGTACLVAGAALAWPLARALAASTAAATRTADASVDGPVPRP